MSLRRTIPLALAATAAVAAPASAAPLVLTEQNGTVGQVVRGGQWAAWVLCPAPNAPAELWARQIGGAKSLVRIPVTGTLAGCDRQRLFGISGASLVLKMERTGEAARAVAVRVTDGAEVAVLDREVADATNTRLVAGDAYGPLVAWVRDATEGTNRFSSVVTWDARTPTAAPVVVRRQSHTGGGQITGVWRGGSGEVMWRQTIPAGQYAQYAVGEESLIRRTAAGALQTISKVGGAVRVAHADLERDAAVYTLIRDDSNAAYIYARTLSSGAKRLLRVAPSAVRPGIRLGPDSPAPSVYGSLVAWRERERLANRTFRDILRGGNLAGTMRVVASERDIVQQRLFQTAPDVYGRFATWAIVRFAGPTGWAGGYSGLSAQPARSQIVVAAIQ